MDTLSSPARSRDSSPSKSSLDDLPSWIKFHLKYFHQRVSYCEGVIMDHYLIVLVQDRTRKPAERREAEEDGYDLSGEEPASLLAFDLLDHSVQQAEIDSGLFAYQVNYSFIKYGENQILQYENGSGYWDYHQSFVCITVESLKPFKVRCEEFEKCKRPFNYPTAQIYKDCLYSYGRVEDYDDGDAKNELWSFDLKNHTWKFCKTSGDGPAAKRFLKSFISQDSLFVYGGDDNKRDLFSLNLNCMRWTKVEQQERYLQGPRISFEFQFGGVLYKDHFITLKKDPKNEKKTTVCCLNLKTKNTWVTFDTNVLANPRGGPINGLMVYNGLLLALGAVNDSQNFVLFVLNLENLGICAPKSAEEEYQSGLFLSQNESDVAFKIDEKVLPAHKKILIKKSKYFAGLFNSNMAESKQDIIEIKDCEYEIFREYLQFIYQDTLDFGADIDRAMKLYTLADKYLQSDLQEKCLNFLKFKINRDNVYKMLAIGHQQNLPQITLWCINFLKGSLNMQNITELVHYLDSQKDPDFKENYQGLIDAAFSFMIKNFSMIRDDEEGHLKLFEDFLIKNIEMKQISSCAKLLGHFEKLPEDEKLYFEKCTSQLKESVFHFVQENLESIMTSTIANDFSMSFLKDFTLYQGKQIKNLKKRMEPTKENNVNEENPELKKTKK